MIQAARHAPRPARPGHLATALALLLGLGLPAFGQTSPPAAEAVPATQTPGAADPSAVPGPTGPAPGTPGLPGAAQPGTTAVSEVPKAEVSGPQAAMPPAADKGPAGDAPATLAAEPSATPASNPARVAKAQAGFALDVVARLSQGPGKGAPKAANVVVSPSSVAAAFSLIELGADEKLREAMLKVLGLDGATARTDLRSLREAMNRSGPGPFVSAGAVLFDRKAGAKPLAVAGLKAVGAEVAEVDLSTAAALERINAWVAGKTRGLIPTILESPLQNAAFVALNALYFKDRWETPFPAAATKAAPFTTAAGSPLSVPMMLVQARLRTREEGRFVGVELGYGDPDFALVVATTRDKPAPASTFAKMSDWLSGEGFSERQTELTLPRFEVSGSIELLPVLDEMGLKAARSSRTALSGLMEAPAFISRIVQKTVLKVDEEGSEAAAATAIVGSRSLQPKLFKMSVDKPFVFALRHRPSGALILSGYVSEPGAASAKPADAKSTR